MEREPVECAYGIRLNGLAEALADEEYPVRATELIAHYGDRQVQVVGESKSVSDVLAVHAACDKRYDSPAAVRETIHCVVGATAVGRQRYSDHGARAANETGGSL